MNRTINLPMDLETARSLSAGEEVLLSGDVLTGRDQACRRFYEMLDRGESLPVELSGQLLYFVGPSPTRPGAVVGSAGPTTAGRMNAFIPRLLEAGVRVILGKGYLAEDVKIALQKHDGAYLGAIGGTGALLSQSITACEVIAFPELLSEAVHRMTFRDFPAIVLNDSRGGDLYASAASQSES